MLPFHRRANGGKRGAHWLAQGPTGIWGPGALLGAGRVDQRGRLPHPRWLMNRSGGRWWRQKSGRARGRRGRREPGAGLRPDTRLRFQPRHRLLGCHGPRLPRPADPSTRPAARAPGRDGGPGGGGRGALRRLLPPGIRSGLRSSLPPPAPSSSRAGMVHSGPPGPAAVDVARTHAEEGRDAGRLR